MTDPSGTTTYTYSNRDQVLTKATPQGTLAYTYDKFGHPLSVVSSNANGTNLAYSPLFAKSAEKARSRVLRDWEARPRRAASTRDSGRSTCAGVVVTQMMATAASRRMLTRIRFFIPSPTDNYKHCSCPTSFQYSCARRSTSSCPSIRTANAIAECIGEHLFWTRCEWKMSPLRSHSEG